jgi:hypothetical protein
MRVRLLAFVGVGALGCATLLAHREARPDGPEDEVATTARVSSNAPAIDRAIPARIESATFALG